MATIFFVTGTDTEVGKTWCTAALARVLARAGRRVAVMKPVAAGAHQTPEGLRNEDALALMRASNVAASYSQVNPCCLPEATSPHLAAALAGVRIDAHELACCAAKLAAAADVLLVEGAGGWHAPISESGTMADIAQAMAARVLLVVGLRLGCLSHALLTQAAVRAAGLEFAGWIGNRLEPAFAHVAQNVATLEQRLRAPCLGVLPYAAPRGPSQAAADAADAALAGAPSRHPFA